MGGAQVAPGGPLWAVRRPPTVCPQAIVPVRQATGQAISKPVLRFIAPFMGMGISGLDDTGQVQGLVFDGEERQKQSMVDLVAD